MDSEGCVYAFMRLCRVKSGKYMCVILIRTVFVVLEASLKLYQVWHSTCLFLPVELNILILLHAFLLCFLLRGSFGFLRTVAPIEYITVLRMKFSSSLFIYYFYYTLDANHNFKFQLKHNPNFGSVIYTRFYVILCYFSLRSFILQSF